MPDSAAIPFLVVSDASGQRKVPLVSSPFTLGRQTGLDLVIPDTSVSRYHARIVAEPSVAQPLGLALIDEGSRSGTFVNGHRIQHHLLADGDVIRLGQASTTSLRFSTSAESHETTLHTLLTRMSAKSGTDSELGKLSWFIEAARRFNDLTGTSEILGSLIQSTLSLTGGERGFVFLCVDSGELALAAGRDASQNTLSDDGSISRTALNRAMETRSEFIVTDTLALNAGLPSHSVMAHNLRAILCIPLYKSSANAASPSPNLLGVLYLDSRHNREQLSSMDHNLLRIISSEAAILIENLRLVQAEEESRRYREELKIAAEIQEGLMRLTVPDLYFARVRARTIPCRGIGGDFYDVLTVRNDLYVVLADVSGKGLSAAILGATLQGIVYAQILAGLPLDRIALFANEFLCQKKTGKYATLILMHLLPTGQLEYINCGHVQPLLHSGSAIASLQNCNLPVGLLTGATYTTDSLSLNPGDTILIVTDGVTEAERVPGDAFGDQRLHDLVRAGACITDILAEIEQFIGEAPLCDDCTLLELCYLQPPT